MTDFVENAGIEDPCFDGVGKADRYRRVAPWLSIARPVPFKKRHSDVFLRTPKEENFLAFFREQDLRAVIDNLFGRTWSHLGFRDIDLRFENCGNFEYCLKIFAPTDSGQELLMLFHAFVEYTRIDDCDEAVSTLGIENLILQNPRRPFDDIHSAMPGQDFPPSGLFGRFAKFVEYLVSCSGLRLVSQIPQYFHTARLFSRYFVYADPEMQAIYRAVLSLLGDNASRQDIRRLSRAFEQGRVLRNGKPYLWPHELQLAFADKKIQDRIKAKHDAFIPPSFDFKILGLP